MKTTLEIPNSLHGQLLSYRNRVWTIKLIEAVAISTAGLLSAFLFVYVVDRWGGASLFGRVMAWAVSIAIASSIPWYLYRWVWSNRDLEPVARLLGKKLPAVGDQLLGVIELSKNDSEQARSPALCQAAMNQVAKDAAGRDFNTAVPECRHVLWTSVAGILFLVVFGLTIVYPSASGNAWARLAFPWSAIPRFMFTRIESLPSDCIVAHGEPISLKVQLDESTIWKPDNATLQIGQQPPIVATRHSENYRFDVPPQISSLPVRLRVGDVDQTMMLTPTLRPELSSIVADVSLPKYLGRDEKQSVDSRSGQLNLVRGSVARLTAQANRELASAKVNDSPVDPDGNQICSEKFQVESTPSLEFVWSDRNGLAGRRPFELSISAIDDEAPTLICDGLQRQSVVLDSETIQFNVRATDDYGVRRVGMMWRGIPGAGVSSPATGERALGAGDHHAEQVEMIGTFSARTLGIEPQPIELFVWAEDYLPGRVRVYSAPHVVYVLTADQHAIWMTEQLSKWHRQALEVRDRERTLHEKNKALRGLAPDALASDENRREIERQASAERSNGRRLQSLGLVGEQLVRTASKNPEIGVGHLERWAEMLRILDDLANQRMPSVADLLADAAQQPSLNSKASPKSIASSSPSGPQAGRVLDSKSGAPSPSAEGPPPKLRSAPSLADVESSMNSPDDGPLTPGAPKKTSSPSLRLPVTTVMGKRTNPDDAPKPPPPAPAIDQAVEEQADVLAEFDKLADELNAVLANLEGSTLVKRLKAASREQEMVASKLTSQLEPAFGQPKFALAKPVVQVFGEIQKTEQESTLKMSFIMDDLSAYFERRRLAQFKKVLDEMRSADVLGGLRGLADDIPTQQGLSVAQAEFWADSMDRWAETLVDPACKGQCPGGKPPESLPPSIVLEVLQILEAEVGLRDETRVTEQSKPVVAPEVYRDSAARLSKTQSDINERVVKVIARIGELEDAPKHFGKELAMLAEVDVVMTDSAGILKSPNTGAAAIAAETEAIELLLKSKRINPKGGGGGGASPGGGGTGNTSDSALALMGQGRNTKEVREDRRVEQTMGQSGPSLPEEFRRGLDHYFDRLGGS